MTDPVMQDVAEANDSQSDADFEDGFNLAAGTETPVVPEAETPPEKAEELPPVVEPDVAKEPVEETVSLTNAEVKSLLARLDDVDRLKSGQDKAFGKLGSLQDTIEKLQSAQATGAAVDLTDEDMAELEDFPEFQGKIKGVLQKVLAKTRGTASAPAAPVDLTPLEQKFDQKIASVSQKYETKLLSVTHRDWREVTSSDKWKLWLGSQPEQFRIQIANSWDAEEIGEAITKFKTTEARVAESRQMKTSRLEAAVTPTGVKSPDTSALNEADAFVAGFKQARG